MVLPDYRHEINLIRKGHKLIAGVDEVGRGPLAGPVVAAAVIFADKHYIKGINDSKKLTISQRNNLYQKIIETASYIAIGIVDVDKINKTNILRAALMAMKKAVSKLRKKPDFLLIDGDKNINVNIPQIALVKGDQKSISIAAASIIAKVTRDRMMYEYHEKYPQYKFNQHKGYGTREHFKLLKKYGPSSLHRTSWACVNQLTLFN